MICNVDSNFGFGFENIHLSNEVPCNEKSSSSFTDFHVCFNIHGKKQLAQVLRHVQNVVKLMAKHLDMIGVKQRARNRELAQGVAPPKEKR